MKTGEDFRREFPQAEEGFRAAEYQALMRLHEEKRRLYMKFKPVIAFILMLMLLMSVGVAATVEKWSLFDSVPDDWRIATDAEKAQMKSSFVPIPIDGKMVDVTIREAIYDGYGVYLVVDVTPKSPNVFLIPYHNADLDEPAGDVVSSFPDDVTLEEYIRALGYRQIYRVDIMTGLAGMFFPATMELNEDGSFAFFFRQRLDRAQDMQQPSLSFTVAANLKSDSRYLEHFDTDVTLTVQPLLEVKYSPAGESHVFANSGLRLSNVQVHRTILTTYVTADVEVVDQDKFDNRYNQYFLRISDSKGNDIKPGYINLIAIRQDDTGEYQYTCTLSLSALPDELSFVEYQVDYDAGHKPVDSWLFRLQNME